MLLYLPLQFPSSLSGKFIKPLPPGRRSKAISHYNMLLVLSCGDLPDTGTRVQFGSLAHTLRNTVLIFTRLCSQKQPNQPVVRNTPSDRSQQCGDELMWVNLAFVGALTVHQQVSNVLKSLLWLVNSGCHSHHKGIQFVLIKSTRLYVSHQSESCLV